MFPSPMKSTSFTFIVPQILKWLTMLSSGISWVVKKGGFHSHFKSIFGCLERELYRWMIKVSTIPGFRYFKLHVLEPAKKRSLFFNFLYCLLNPWIRYTAFNRRKSRVFFPLHCFQPVGSDDVIYITWEIQLYARLSADQTSTLFKNGSNYWLRLNAPPCLNVQIHLPFSAWLMVFNINKYFQT